MNRGKFSRAAMEKCAEYIKGEYEDDLGITELILKRHNITNPRLALEITGYFTGCMTIGGEPRASYRNRADEIEGKK